MDLQPWEHSRGSECLHSAVIRIWEFRFDPKSLAGCGALDSGGLDYTEFNSKGPKPYFCMSLAKFVFICLNLSIIVFMCPDLLFCLDLFFYKVYFEPCGSGFSVGV